MKSAQFWLDKWVGDGDGEWERSEVKTYVFSFIQAIQKDAFDAGRVAGLKEANFMIGPNGAVEQIILQLLQPKDTPCSKNTP